MADTAEAFEELFRLVHSHKVNLYGDKQADDVSCK